MRRATIKPFKIGENLIFLSTLSLRRATPVNIQRPTAKNDFYPRSPCGERRCPYTARAAAWHFYPRSPCGERLYLRYRCTQHWIISIHALLAESDAAVLLSWCSCVYFYPRSPCGERPVQFVIELGECFISIHALLAESDIYKAVFFPPPAISIHALLAESDLAAVCYDYYSIGFLSTLSLRRATLAGPSGPAFLFNFYPRSPCGERLILAMARLLELLFLSTLSLRRATQSSRAGIRKQIISIHALLAESDSSSGVSAGRMQNFYPRSPCGERPRNGFAMRWNTCISIHALLAESDRNKQHRLQCNFDFYPRSPCGERLEEEPKK